VQIVNIHATKTHFSRLVDEAASGEEIIIAKAGKPVARLVPLAPPGQHLKRRLGILAGIAVIPPDFDIPLPDDVIDSFEGRWVRLLLDTNVLLWALIEPAKLKPDIRALLEDPMQLRSCSALPAYGKWRSRQPWAERTSRCRPREPSLPLWPADSSNFQYARRQP
jgi:prevent-host-death family protein